MYADDTNVTVVGKTGEEIEKSLNSELENIHKWLLANKLTLNVKGRWQASTHIFCA